MCGMRRSYIVPALLGALALAFMACGDGSPMRTLSEPESPCAETVRAEFERQQSLVDWSVYCPSQLPESFRLATPGDPPIGEPNLAENAKPTLDMLYEPDPRRLSTFVTRLTDGAGRDLVFVQGAGASIYNRRDESRCPGCFEVPRRGAMFGGLSGTLFELQPPAVVAWDGDMGHMLIGYGLNVGELTEVARDMRRLQP
jgi:hypothetical protein